MFFLDYTCSHRSSVGYVAEICTVGTASFRILVVDDVATNLELAKRILLREGYKVDTAADGDSTLKMIASQPYNLVLLDIQMPDPDGFEVCRRIRQQTKTAELPVILLSASDLSADPVTKSEEVGATSFLMKPFTVEGLNQAVAAVLECQ